MKKDKEKRVAVYARVGKIGQLDSLVDEKIESKLSPIVAGEYIRVGGGTTDSQTYSVYNQQKRLEEYCKKHNIINRIRYIDIGKSALDCERPALKKMIEDLKNGKINKIVVTDISRLFRNPIQAEKFLSSEFMNGIEIISLDHSIEDYTKNMNLYLDLLKNDKTTEDKEIDLEF